MLCYKYLCNATRGAKGCLVSLTIFDGYLNPSTMNSTNDSVGIAMIQSLLPFDQGSYCKIVVLVVGMTLISPNTAPSSFNAAGGRSLLLVALFKHRWIGCKQVAMFIDLGSGLMPSQPLAENQGWTIIILFIKPCGHTGFMYCPSDLSTSSGTTGYLLLAVHYTLDSSNIPNSGT